MPHPPDSYFSKRFEPNLQYYEKAAKRASTLHIGLSSLQILATASIPVVNALSKSVEWSTILAAIATVATGVATVLQPRENWLRYRHFIHELSALRARFDMRVAPFDGESPLTELVDQTERLLSDEAQRWETHFSTRSTADVGAPKDTPKRT